MANINRNAVHDDAQCRVVASIAEYASALKELGVDRFELQKEIAKPGLNGISIGEHIVDYVVDRFDSVDAISYDVWFNCINLGPREFQERMRRRNAIPK